MRRAPSWRAACQTTHARGSLASVSRFKTRVGRCHPALGAACDPTVLGPTARRLPPSPLCPLPSPLPRGAHPASPLLHPFDQTPPSQPDPGAKAPACLPKATHCGVPERVPSGLQKDAHLPVPAPDVNPPGDGLPARCCEPHEDRVPAPHREPHGDGGPAPGHEPHKDGVCVLCAAVESSSWSEAAGEARRGDAH